MHLINSMYVVLSVIVVVAGFILFCYFACNNVYCLFSLPLSVSLVYVSLFSGLLCCFFYVLMAASFDGPRPLLVACHWQFCSLAINFVRSFVMYVTGCYKYYFSTFFMTLIDHVYCGDR